MTVISDEQSKAFAPIDVTGPSIAKEVSALQRMKADFPMDVTLLPITTEARAEQSLKLSSPIDVTEAGTEIAVNDLQ